jgi:hypothetical protein
LIPTLYGEATVPKPVLSNPPVAVTSVISFPTIPLLLQTDLLLPDQQKRWNWNYHIVKRRRVGEEWKKMKIQKERECPFFAIKINRFIGFLFFFGYFNSWVWFPVIARAKPEAIQPIKTLDCFLLVPRSRNDVIKLLVLHS